MVRKTFNAPSTACTSFWYASEAGKETISMALPMRDMMDKLCVVSRL